MPIVERVGPEADLVGLVAEIDAATWDEANDLAPYESWTLADFVADPNHVFVVCRASEDGALMGIASGRVCAKPYPADRWLWVDEVDVVADRRRRGAGRALMEALLGIARRAGCGEVWLATERDNDAADGLYSSLGPTDREVVVGFTWGLDR